MSHRVLITTLSLNGNYGGILQAFALQRVVRDLGFEPVTDTSRPKSLLKRLRWRLLQQPYRWFRRVSRSRSDRQWLMSRRVTAPLRAFVAQNIRTGSYMEIAGTPRGRARLARRYRTFVVGSDQVWRARYADIPTQFLDVLEPIAGGRPRRISYAASFGVDDIAEYTPDDRSRAAALIRRFDAVSVREDSGVAICREEFGVGAERHVDPTMLLTVDRYRALVSRAEGVVSPAAGRLLLYRLDSNDEIGRIQALIDERLGLPTLEFLPSQPSGYDAFAADPGSSPAAASQAVFSAARADFGSRAPCVPRGLIRATCAVCAARADARPASRCARSQSPGRMQKHRSVTWTLLQAGSGPRRRRLGRPKSRPLTINQTPGVEKRDDPRSRLVRATFKA